MMKKINAPINDLKSVLDKGSFKAKDRASKTISEINELMGLNFD